MSPSESQPPTVRTVVPVPVDPSTHDSTEDHSPDGNPPPPLPRSGGYEIGAEIARGGMGVVYRGRDIALNREVAIKVLQDKYPADSGTARRFVEEAQITGQLQHPGIPAVHHVGTLSDGRPFLAMKLVKGRSLHDLLTDRGPAAPNFLAVFEQVAQAVGYAHAHGVVHRDLKPHNVMVGAFGEVQVMDWGLAKVLTSGGVDPHRSTDPDATVGTEIKSLRNAGDATSAGSVLGTPAYMPPEQAIGAADQVDLRSDVFGLGGVLCAILTGRPPYVGANAESTRQLAARAKLDEAFAALDGCGAEPELVALCKRCLSAEKADRPADANVVAAEVAKLRAAADDRARQAEVERERAAVRAVEERKRRRAWVILTSAVAVCVGMIGCGAVWVQSVAIERLRERAAAAAEAAAQAERARTVVRQVLARLPELYDRGLWGQADAALGQAAEAIGPTADAGLLAQVAEGRSDTDLLRALDGVRFSAVASTFSVMPSTAHRKSERYADVFRQAGHPITTDDVRSLVPRLSHPSIRAHIVAALDDWAAEVDDPAVRRRLLALTTALEPHPWRVKLPDALTDLDRLVALLEEIPEDQLTPDVAVTIASYMHQLSVQDLETRLLQPNGFAPVSRALDLGLKLLENAGRRHPSHFGVHFNLGDRYTLAGEYVRARGAYTAAIALRPDHVGAYRGFAGTFMMAAETPEDFIPAVQAYRTAVRIAPEDAGVHLDLGQALDGTGDAAGAEAEYREAIRLNSADSLGYLTLANSYFRGGRHEEAVVEYRQARAQFAKLPHNRYTEPVFPVLDENIRRAERAAALDRRLNAVRAGAKPNDREEAVALADLALKPFRRYYATAYHLLAETLEGTPTPSAAPAGLRFRAACAAIRFAAGDDPTTKPSAAERVTARRRALGWLTGELAAGGDKPGAAVVGDWLQAPDLFSVRHPMAIAFLPPEERAEWRAFWAQVRLLAATPAKPAVRP